MGIRLFKENGSLSICPENLILNYFFIKHDLSVIKLSNTFVFFLRMSGEYLRRYEQGSDLKIRLQGSVVKTDPCPYLFKYSSYVLKKKSKVLDIFITDKKCFIKI
jgi:hypothetical protein